MVIFSISIFPFPDIQTRYCILRCHCKTKREECSRDLIEMFHIANVLHQNKDPSTHSLR